jgi:predicted phage terminase large subunit-like protein
MSMADSDLLPEMETLLDLIAPLRLRHCPLVPTARQEAFLRLFGPEVFYGGAAGGGKSVALVMAAAQYTDVPGYRALVVRRTLGELERPGGAIDLAHDWFGPTKAVWRGDQRVYRFPGPGRSGADGASISFSYLDGQQDVGRYAGSSFSFIGLDELPQIDESTYQRMRRVLRQATNQLARSPDGLTLADVPVRIRSTGNPGGLHHEWIRRYFVDPDTRADGVVYLASKWGDNPHLDLDAYKKQLESLPPAERERLINGDWDVPDDGSMFRREWFAIIEAADVPCARRACRYWDLAASVPTPTNPDPDATVGIRVDLDDTGTYHIVGIVRQRLHAGDVERLIAATAEEDGDGVEIVIEQEPGSQGEFYAKHLKSDVLPGYRVLMDPVSTPKEGRAYAVAAAAQQGWIKLVAGPHTDLFLDELAQFPNGRHDDCVDALSGALRALGPRHRIAYGSGVPRGEIDNDDGLERLYGSAADWFR